MESKEFILYDQFTVDRINETLKAIIDDRHNNREPLLPESIEFSITPTGALQVKFKPVL